jgi:opacity protein-like surface antigen
MKTFTLVLALCAMLAVAHAADVDTTVELANNKKHAKHGGYGYDEKEHKHEKRFDIFPGEAETCNGDTRECGETFGLS